MRSAVVVWFYYEGVILRDVIKVFRAVVKLDFLLIPSHQVFAMYAEAVRLGDQFEVISTDPHVRNACIFCGSLQHDVRTHKAGRTPGTMIRRPVEWVIFLKWISIV